VVVDEPELDVERHVLGQVADGVVGLGPEGRAGLVDPLEHPDHDLLVELRALRQVGRPAEVVEREDVRAALGRGADDLRRLDLGVAEPVERRAEAGQRCGGDGQTGADARVPQRDGGVVEQRGERRLELAAAHLERRRTGRGAEDGDGGPVQLDAARCLVRGDDGPGHLDDGLRLEGGDGRTDLLVVDHDLGDAPGVAEQQERHLGEVSLVVHPAGDGHLLADVLGERLRPDACHPWLLRVDRSLAVRAGGCPAVPPHFTAARGSGLVLL
jgi:hypothetical protein